jgi:hypothetical protein
MTNPFTPDEFTSRLTTILSDVALTNALKANCPAFAALLDAAAPPVRKVEPLPSLAAITAAQATLWDNWPGGRRANRYPNRYAMTLKVWTTPNVILKGRGNHQHEVTAALMDATALKKWVKGKRKVVLKNPIAPLYLDSLADFAGAMGDDDLVGMFAGKAEGTVFYDHQWVWMTRTDEEWRGTLSINGEALPMPSFDDSYANGASLGGNAVAQSRMDLCGFSATWATPGIDDVVRLKAA